MTEENFSAEAPVTGQGRMDVAWGANTGDEAPEHAQTATTAKSGEIFEHITPHGRVNSIRDG